MRIVPLKPNQVEALPDDLAFEVGTLDDTISYFREMLSQSSTFVIDPGGSLGFYAANPEPDRMRVPMTSADLEFYMACKEYLPSLLDELEKKNGRSKDI